MRKIVFSILLSIMALLGGCGKEESITNNNNNSESLADDASENEANQVSSNVNDGKQVPEEILEDSPITITDLFDGDTRIWYYIQAGDARDGLAYDNKVKAILVSENKEITSIYYNLKNVKCFLTENDFEEKPNPFRERFLLEEFDSMSDEEIIDAVKKTYVDASQTYNFDINSVYEEYGNVAFDYNAYSSFEAVTFPYSISYEGELDSTGNVYNNETIYLFDNAKIIAYFYFNQSADGENLSSSFHVSRIITPSVIKNKEYVGIEDENGNMLITENTYTTFNDIELDTP